MQHLSDKHRTKRHRCAHCNHSTDRGFDIRKHGEIHWRLDRKFVTEKTRLDGDSESQSRENDECQRPKEDISTHPSSRQQLPAAERKDESMKNAPILSEIMECLGSPLEKGGDPSSPKLPGLQEGADPSCPRSSSPPQEQHIYSWGDCQNPYRSEGTREWSPTVPTSREAPG